MMTEMEPIRILIVDDHPIVRSGFAALISDEADMLLVGQASDGAEGIALLETCGPHVVLLDMSLPDMSGLDLIARMREIRQGCYIVVLSARAGGAAVRRALAAGAHTYLLKDTRAEELLTVIRTVSRGGRYLPPSLGRQADTSGPSTDLTQRELQVLQLMARGGSNAEIAAQLGISEATAKWHVKNTLGKLGVDSRTKAIALGLKIGLLQSGEV